VIATLWKADDAAASQLMVDFYRHWTGGSDMTKVHGLQQAQLDLLNQTASPPSPAAGPPQPNYPRHPYYWAPFILMGNWK
jgi:CHAT domain-containing protein